MRIVKTVVDPSREDAVRMRRVEKDAILHLMHAATILDEAQNDLKDRLGMIDSGADRMRQISQDTDELMHDIRLTIPDEQRRGLENIASDVVVRLVPKATPHITQVVMDKEEFRTLVDSARVRCRECAEDDVGCEQCDLYRLLTSILPLDDYHSTYMCPYNLGKWRN